MNKKINEIYISTIIKQSTIKNSLFIKSRLRLIIFLINLIFFINSTKNLI